MCRFLEDLFCLVCFCNEPRSRSTLNSRLDHELSELGFSDSIVKHIVNDKRRVRFLQLEEGIKHLLPKTTKAEVYTNIVQSVTTVCVAEEESSETTSGVSLTMSLSTDDTTTQELTKGDRLRVFLFCSNL